ncbi:MAG: amidohydrolase family protein [Pyrinomonadaceae bacterium]|nr:amidohydrolase family protein [Pyrinomonadaceae bacterium]
MRSKLLLPLVAAFCLLLGASAYGQSYAITNARIVTVSGATIEKGTVVIRNGLIEAVGANAAAPADAQVFDAAGLTVYPGFIDTLTNLGMPAAAARTGGPGGGGGQTPAAAAAPTSNSNYPAGLRPEDEAVNELRAGEAQFEANRNAGFTTVLTTGRSGIFNGRSAVIDLAGDSVSSMVIRAPFAQHVTFTTIGGGNYPASLLGTFAALRQMLYDAQRQREIEKMYATNPRGMKRPEADRSLEALYPAIDREMPVVFTANREIEIIRALDLIKEFKLNGIIAGGLEAWKVADRLKAQNVAVLLSLNLPKRTSSASPDADPETMETLRFRAEAPKCAAKLAAAGVKFAFQSDNIRSLGDFFTNAGKAVESGLNKDAAIRAMTLGAAEILGVDKMLGSIEAGKIANIVVVKGDVFGKDRAVTHVFVDGKYFEQKEPPKREANAPTASGTSASGQSIAGSYSVTIQIPGEPMAATLTFSQAGPSLSGTMVSPLGSSQIKNGRVSPDGFSFGSSVEFGGAAIDISVSGKVTGSQISGIIDSPQGAVPFSGTRNP